MRIYNDNSTILGEKEEILAGGDFSMPLLLKIIPSLEKINSVIL